MHAQNKMREDSLFAQAAAIARGEVPAEAQAGQPEAAAPAVVPASPPVQPPAPVVAAQEPPRPALEAVTQGLLSPDPEVRGRAEYFASQFYPHLLPPAPAPQAPPPVDPVAEDNSLLADIYQGFVRDYTPRVGEPILHTDPDTGETKVTGYKDPVCTFQPDRNKPGYNPEHERLLVTEFRLRKFESERQRQQQAETQSAEQYRAQYIQEILPATLDGYAQQLVAGVPVLNGPPGTPSNSAELFKVGGRTSPTLINAFRSEVQAVKADPRFVSLHDQMAQAPPHLKGQAEARLRNFVQKEALIRAQSREDWKEVRGYAPAPSPNPPAPAAPPQAPPQQVAPAASLAPPAIPPHLLNAAPNPGIPAPSADPLKDAVRTVVTNRNGKDWGNMYAALTANGITVV